MSSDRSVTPRNWMLTTGALAGADAGAGEGGFAGGIGVRVGAIGGCAEGGLAAGATGTRLGALVWDVSEQAATISAVSAIVSAMMVVSVAGFIALVFVMALL